MDWSVRHDELVADELGSRVSDLIASGDTASRSHGFGLILELPWINRVSAYSFWAKWSREQARIHGPEIALEAARNGWVMTTGLYAGSISVGQALTIAGGLIPLLKGARNSFSDLPIAPYASQLAGLLITDRFVSSEETARAISELTVIGRHLINHRKQSWPHSGRPYLVASYSHNSGIIDKACAKGGSFLRSLDEVACLGLITLVCICAEMEVASGHDRSRLNRLDLPVPAQFKQVFYDWAKGRVNFVEINTRE
jgi:hypothetical protein